MKRVILLLTILLCTAAGAQQRFSCQFKMVDNTTGKTVAEGKGYVQDESYRLETDWMQVYCNGKDRWIYSPGSDEMVIENNDVSFLKEIKVSKAADRTAVVLYDTYTITLTDIQEKPEAWSATFFIIDPAIFGDDTIITDLRK
ncbi:MAG: hypothetical protein IIT50_04825 [Bacteroidales bacterium]|jgi:hypothetical protein|nr:hypothetical protein [Bacteroidales bacterium]MBQ1636514.1 hypothetical protein [Bacteroidales bacterium]MBQ1680345.1 hypothetical protein [Bacteroidales bacterium]MBQ1831392.1 hypothetical protein [Bacteroidales bacterium]MBQ2149293.1 hypothetical protein [Bacteroidales bacterium]